jgi:hypothetical protein
MENELISKSFGPFLKKRMHETRTYCVIDPVTPTKDKRARARAIQGRMMQRRVHFPAFAPWWPNAKLQLLKFPFGTNDDFVDWLAWLGLGLLKEVGASTPAANDDKVVRVGSWQWIRAAAAKRRERDARQKLVAGW